MKRLLRYEPAGGGPERDVVVTIDEPIEADDGSWSARLRIEGFDDVHDAPVYGVDGVQTVVEALWLAPTLIEHLARGGRVTFEGSEDLGFSHSQPRTP